MGHDRRGALKHMDSCCQVFYGTSGCPLETSSGLMLGAYEMATDDGESFDISVPAFSLDTPNAQNPLH